MGSDKSYGENIAGQGDEGGLSEGSNRCGFKF